ncbi:hypothetical protein [Streptomyces sp. NPDC051997]|uniref:hypothetical protein n=1 Tax=Streptomyces sp. NPDC051997 TaxID=3155611 RepID=UPI0034428395
MSRPAPRPRANHTQTAQAARKLPGTWITVSDYRSNMTARSVAYRIRTGAPLGTPSYGTPYVPAEAFETRMELLDLDTRLQVRFIATAEGVQQ